MQTSGAQFVAISLEIGKYQVTSETYNLLGQRVLHQNMTIQNN